MKKFTFLLLIVVIFSNYISAQSKLKSGPMLGYNEMREVAIWIQTTEPAKVKIAYWPDSIKGKNIKSVTKYSPEHSTLEENVNTATLILGNLEPGVKYQYQVIVNGKIQNTNNKTEFTTQSLWQWRTDPPNFKVLIGSCYYGNEPVYDRPGRGYGGEYDIFESMNKVGANAMVWLGDNVYLREVDWFSRSGILHRYDHARALPQLQPLLSSMHHYAIWDDHDFGPNDGNRSFRNKHYTTEAFKMFFPNPPAAQSKEEGIYTMFQWGDVEFYLLDNRTFRSPHYRTTGKKEALGDKQIEWLIDNLKYSRAPFKFVCVGSQFLNPVDKFENLSQYPERDSIINLITKENINGVIFLTGDRHFTELTEYKRNGTYPLYDLTVSPLTSGAYKGAEKEENTMRVENTIITDRNFGVLEFSGERTDRVLTIKIYNSKGELQWTKEMKAKELK
jgi:alkaline phosphatase D